MGNAFLLTVSVPVTVKRDVYFERAAVGVRKRTDHAGTPGADILKQVVDLVARRGELVAPPIKVKARQPAPQAFAVDSLGSGGAADVMSESAGRNASVEQREARGHGVGGALLKRRAQVSGARLHVLNPGETTDVGFVLTGRPIGLGAGPGKQIFIRWNRWARQPPARYQPPWSQPTSLRSRKHQGTHGAAQGQSRRKGCLATGASSAPGEIR
ncbi:hypothetical protein ACWD0A_27940 [Streptomyces sp. NPDC002867]